ncbi:LuxR C-terminal-related transcriptional regulator [Serratia sp. L9]|uniref:LuxR C-terminal-related transcriptional regulator n=1 Tax=Serratia sp. L9 TaxID=3423946 RepID=UPI003D6686F4
MQEGIPTPIITEKMGVRTKTFYTHRRNIMLKLGIENRVSLYRKIFNRENKRQEEDDVLQESTL